MQPEQKIDLSDKELLDIFSLRMEKIIYHLPATIRKGKEVYILTIRKEPRYQTKDMLVYYEDELTGKLLYLVAVKGLRDALLEMLIWLAENGYVDFKDK